MSNHIHLIASADGKIPLSDIIRDFKKFTASSLIKLIKNNKRESRKSWMMHRFEWNAKQHSGDRKHQFWKRDNHPIALFTPKVTWQKIDYIHLNPVKAGIVWEPDHYLYSSASNYAGKEGHLEITLMDHFDPTGFVFTGMG